MQMTFVASIMILFSLLPIQQKSPATGEQRKTPVELWCVGDDVFTKGMCQAFFAAFESSPDFKFAGEKQAWKSHRYDPAKRWVERSGETHESDLYCGIQYVGRTSVHDS